MIYLGNIIAVTPRVTTMEDGEVEVNKMESATIILKCRKGTMKSKLICTRGSVKLDIRRAKRESSLTQIITLSRYQME